MTAPLSGGLAGYLPCRSFSRWWCNVSPPRAPPDTRHLDKFNTYRKESRLSPSLPSKARLRMSCLVTSGECWLS